MNRILLKDIYCCQNKDITEYMDIFFETNLGIFKNEITSNAFTDSFDLRAVKRLGKLDLFRESHLRHQSVRFVDLAHHSDN